MFPIYELVSRIQQKYYCGGRALSNKIGKRPGKGRPGKPAREGTKRNRAGRNRPEGRPRRLGSVDRRVSGDIAEEPGYLLGGFDHGQRYFGEALQAET